MSAEDQKVPSNEVEQKEEKSEKKKKEKPQAAVEPEYIRNRVQHWEKLYSKFEEERKQLPQNEIIVTLPDGKQLPATSNVTSPLDLANKISNSMAKRIVAAKVNDTMWDLTRPLEESCKIELIDFEHKDGQHVFWHSSAHVLGQAIEKEFADAKLCIGPALEDGGFYYDFHNGDKHVTPEDYKNIEKAIDNVVKAKQPFQRLVLKKEDALEMFKDNSFKVEIISNKVPDGASCTAYRCGNLIDLCRGPHLPTTGHVKAIGVTKHSSAYWLGKADRESLQRVYGISFPDKDKFKEYKELLKKAEERDHRRVGVKQQLFFFNDLSPGSCFFLPHGARIYNKLVEFIRVEYRKHGYSEVISPNVYNIELWKTSGHYDNYKENMFLFQCEDVEFGVKPMNCPGHCIMFGHNAHSYRDLPLRYADFGVLHRNEISGALSGLTRVRRFQQDDAHIFCRHDQIEQEVGGVLDMLTFVYGIFGFDFHIGLSTRPEKFLGELDTWNKAEAALESCLKKLGKPFHVNAGDGAFYGPKIDIQICDALKRKHQCGTIQLDFNLPVRFKLHYKNEQDRHETPVMIHRAILGSVERMLAILIEHTGGKWPFWLSPRQVMIVPVSDKSFDYAQKVHQQIHDAGFFVDVDMSNRQLPKKVREAQLEGFNFILVVGEKEAVDGTVNVRKRDHADHDAKSISVAEAIVMLEDIRKQYL